MNNASEFDLKIVKDIFPKDTHKEETRSAPMTSSLTAENLADLLLPTADSLVGPLVFIGTSILELNGV
ncbi:MAG: hypothetical protein LBD75_00275 [Candidatus Peribacteria bacterium]|jgi:hypothetical protein|nr:hypothetical protein [Candidatus Peribacteria bacterium]